MSEYMKLVAAADKATREWLENDSAENFAAMVSADDARIAAEAAGLNKITMSAEVAEYVWSNSAIGKIFNAQDALRAARSV